MIGTCNFVPNRPHLRWMGALAGLFALGPRPAAAFDVERHTTGALLRYADRPVAIYVVYKGAPIGLTPAMVHKAVQGAIDAWVQIAGTRIPLAYGGLMAEPARYDVTVRFDPNYAIGDGEALARTERQVGPGGELLRSDIVVNAHDVQWTGGMTTGTAQVTADLQGVLTHQVGHVLGIGHSRHHDATMYFHATSSAARSLHDDDHQAARFLWPKDGKRIVKATQCDACDGDVDCADGALCLAWPDGARHCARGCAHHNDCAIGTSCGTYGTGGGAGQACLPNEGHCKPDAASAGLGDACASDTACVGGYCMPGGDVGFCTRSCSNCEAPGQCVQTNVGGLCLIAGKGLLGAQCWLPGNCQSFLCSPSIFGGGNCARSCGSGCPSGWQCGEGNVCAPAKNAAGLPVGWPCKSGFDCAAGHCVAVSNGRFPKVCAQACTVATDCPTGTGCAKLGESTLCLPVASAGPIAGLPCPTSGQCGGALVCDEGLVPGLGACRALCDPFALTHPCGSGEVCAYVGAKSAQAGACRPAVGGSRPWGAECSAVEPCRADLVCALAAGDPASPLATGVCRFDCALGSGAGCEAGDACVPVASQARGACIPGGKQGTKVTEIVSTAGKPVNFAARAIALPKTVRASQWKHTPPPPPARAPAQDCAAGRAPGSGLGLIAVVAAWIALQARRRSRA
ncbi:MAG: matrixin family metalloprotease [Deltaproteobacteria bacterium]|nr:matrixin family metalloprotease [Deltaproteobacteria bacterium]